METTRCRQSLRIAIFQRTLPVQDEQHPETDTSPALGQRPVTSLQHRDSPGKFYFCQQLSFHQTETGHRLAVRACTPSKETRAGARLCCGTPGTRMPEKYRPGDHNSSFCCIYLGNTTTSFFILNESLILIQGLGRRLSTCSKIKRSQAAL